MMRFRMMKTFSMLSRGNMSSQTLADYLQQKAANFHAFLNAQNPDAELQLHMGSYQPMLLVPTVMTVLLPLANSGKLESAADDVMSHLSPAGNPKEVRDKVLHYLQCFVDVGRAMKD